MRVLVNYNKADKPHLSSLAYLLRQQGIEAVSSASDMTIGELMSKAAAGGCQAVLLSNEQTLRYCVPGDAPTADKWRGSRLEFTVPVIVINRLSHIHTVSHGAWLMSRDIAKVKHVYRSPQQFSFEPLTESRYFKDALEDLRGATALAYDIETKTFKGKADNQGGPTLITCVSWTGVFERNVLRTYVLPFINFGKMHWDTDKDHALALHLLRNVNALPMPKAMHNGMYDSTHSLIYHCPPVNYCYDTMAMAHAEFSELPKTLDFVASYLLYDYIFWKDSAERATKQKDIQGYWGYNGKDTWNTARIMIEQLKNAPAYARKNYAGKFKLSFPSLYCNFEGVKIDEQERVKLRAEAEIVLHGAQKRLRVKLADPNFNPGSWQQVERYIYKIFGATRPNIGKSKSCTDGKNLLSVAEQHPLLARLTADILAYREKQKAIGTYFDFVQYKGRMLYALNPFGTDTERMACSQSSLWCGAQVQNIPGYAKNMLVADEGFELFEADFKQAEGRTTAYCAGDEALIAALENAEKDFYKTLGTLFFDIPYEEVTDFFRNKVLKRIVHGTNYMMGAKTFIENIGVMILYDTAEKLGLRITPTPVKGSSTEYSLKGFATMLLESYHRPFHHIRPWYARIKNEIAMTGYLVSPVGHVRKFFGDINRDHNMLRSGVAHQPQNLSGHVLNLGYERIYNEIVLPSNGDFRLKAQIHDSIFGQIRLGMRDKYLPQVQKCMDNPIIVHGRTMRIPVDIKVGLTWAERETKKDGTIENPNGTVKWKGPKNV